MPSQPPVATRFCPGGRWTQVEWYVGTIWLTKRYDSGAVPVQWRWFSAGLIPYWAGGYTSRGCVSIPPSFYTSLEFLPASDVNLIISATC